MASRAVYSTQSLAFDGAKVRGGAAGRPLSLCICSSDRSDGSFLGIRSDESITGSIDVLDAEQHALRCRTRRTAHHSCFRDGRLRNFLLMLGAMRSLLLSIAFGCASALTPLGTPRIIRETRMQAAAVEAKADWNGAYPSGAAEEFDEALQCLSLDSDDESCSIAYLEDVFRKVDTEKVK